MDNLINYLLSNQILKSDSINSYNKFQQRSREALTHGYVEDYFRQWQAFMRGVIEENHEQVVKGLTQRLKNELPNDGEMDEMVEKYDTLLNDVKFSLGEFLKSGDEEYLSLMSRSLGIDIDMNNANTKGAHGV